MCRIERGDLTHHLRLGLLARALGASRETHRVDVRSTQDREYEESLAADREAADAIMNATPGCVDLVGRTGLGELATLFRHAGAVIGNDTGPTFLAARVGTPTLMLMGADTDPSMSAPVGARAGWLRKDRISEIASDDALAALDRFRSG